MKTEPKGADQTAVVNKLADHRTPFVFNEWYVAGFSDEISRTLKDRVLLGIGVLLYRSEAGAPVALRNRCPHRSFPLSRGALEGDDVVCGYHGLTFRPDGRCIRIPSQDHIPDVVRARNFPIVERAPLVWIWMGDPALADPAHIPDHAWLSASDFTHFRDYIHIGSNYVRLHENVLDLTHFPFVHGEAAGDIVYAQTPFEVTTKGDSVCVTRVLDDYPVPVGYAAFIGNHGHRVHRRSETWYKTPALHVGHDLITDLEGGVDGRTDFHFTIAHFFTPETASGTHYFWTVARDVKIDDTELSKSTAPFVNMVFKQDEDVVVAVEELWKQERDDFEEISVAGDRAGLLMRRAIARRAQGEA